MTIVILLIVFVAGIACGLALRPTFDRRRRVKYAYAMARERRAARREEAAAAAEEAPVAMPRDYYSADRNARGSLGESFGLKSGVHTARTAETGEPEITPVSMPRDYYERETPDDEGILSESFGLKRKGEGQA